MPQYCATPISASIASARTWRRESDACGTTGTLRPGRMLGLTWWAASPTGRRTGRSLVAANRADGQPS
eukprot:697301-Prymnesium_polylepis.2